MSALAAKLSMTVIYRFFETFSFLPPLDDGEISRQVDYIIANGWTPCLEFAPASSAYVDEKYNIRFGNSASCVRSSDI
jgi:ribulose-bisphosphate carboxylase small chain